MPAAKPKAEPFFTPAVFDFLNDLKANNTKDWFAANKARYDTVIVEPALRFIEAVDAKLTGKLNEYHGTATRARGSLFRIHRDTRFSKDKTPYKTNVGLHFDHTAASKATSDPGFYLHIEPDRAFVAAGIVFADNAALSRVRTSIDEHLPKWKRATKFVTGSEAERNNDAAQWYFAGESLKRPPKGFDADHPAIDALKRKWHIACIDLEPSEVTEPDFLKRFMALCSTSLPLNEFLAQALALESA